MKCGAECDGMRGDVVECEVRCEVRDALRSAMKCDVMCEMRCVAKCVAKCEMVRVLWCCAGGYAATQRRRWCDAPLSLRSTSTEVTEMNEGVE